MNRKKYEILHYFNFNTNLSYHLAIKSLATSFQSRKQYSLLLGIWPVIQYSTFLSRSDVQFLVGAHDIYTQSEGNPTYIQATEFAEVSKNIKYLYLYHSHILSLSPHTIKRSTSINKGISNVLLAPWLRLRWVWCSKVWRRRCHSRAHQFRWIYSGNQYWQDHSEIFFFFHTDMPLTSMQPYIFHVELFSEILTNWRCVAESLLLLARDFMTSFEFFLNWQIWHFCHSCTKLTSRGF